MENQKRYDVSKIWEEVFQEIIDKHKDEGLLLSFLKKFNCGKCCYYGRGYGRSMCFYNGLDKGMCLWPDCFFPHVCKNFEPLKEGEELGEVYDRLKK